jgi:hypothetical protein
MICSNLKIEGTLNILLINTHPCPEWGRNHPGGTRTRDLRIARTLPVATEADNLSQLRNNPIVGCVLYIKDICVRNIVNSAINVQINRFGILAV